MKKLAFITGVLMSIAPVTQAQPWRGDTYDHHDYDRRTDEGARQTSRFVPLAAIDITRKETVDIGSQAGTFLGLRLRALRGAPYVDFMTVRFANGEQQHYDIRRRVGRGEIVDVPFDGAHRYVMAVTVHGRPDRWSQIQVLGMR